MKTFRANIKISLKKSVLDPQGTTLKHALYSMGYDQVKEVRVGKSLEVQLQEKDLKTAESKIEQMCHKLFSNPVIEEYTFKLTEES